MLLCSLTSFRNSDQSFDKVGGTVCVIAICEFARLTDEQVALMYDANPRGGGVAWREFDEESNTTVVKWKKGLNKEEMVKFNQDLPLPYVLHFRVPSTGTSQSFFACHPFQVDDEATTGFEGKTPGYVLFHNGFWHDWKAKIQSIAINGYVTIPTGPWSDSRGLAWAANHLGLGFLEMVDEKVVAFGPNDEDIEVFGSWNYLKATDPDGKEATILVSNKGWEKPSYSSTDRRGQSSAVQQPSITALAQASISPGVQAGGTGQQGSFCGTSGNTSNPNGAQGNNAGRVQEAVEGPAGGSSSADHQRVAGQERLDTLIGGVLLKCSACPKRTPVGQFINGTFHCMQCWARKMRPSKPRVGLCQTCRVNHTASRVVEGEKWICHTCWETNGTPKIFFMGGWRDQAE
jgi:hypothetical protein